MRGLRLGLMRLHKPPLDAERAAADVVTAANTEEGFARAMEKFILGEHEPAERPLRKLRA